MSIKNKKAFTLIEMLVVVVIIAILAAIALPQYQKTTLNAKVSSIKQTISDINKALDLFYMTYGYYPTTQEEVDSLDLKWGDINNYRNDIQCTVPYNSRDPNWICIDCYTEKLTISYCPAKSNYTTKGYNCMAFTTDLNDRYNKVCQNLTGDTSPTVTQLHSPKVGWKDDVNYYNQIDAK